MKVDDDSIRWIGGQIAKVAPALQHGEVHLIASGTELYYPFRGLIGVPVDKADAIHSD